MVAWASPKAPCRATLTFASLPLRSRFLQNFVHFLDHLFFNFRCSMAGSAAVSYATKVVVAAPTGGLGHRPLPAVGAEGAMGAAAGTVWAEGGLLGAYSVVRMMAANMSCIRGLPHSGTKQPNPLNLAINRRNECASLPVSRSMPMF